MPELPDVEGFRRRFRRHAAGKRVDRVRAEREIVRNATPRALSAALRGRRFGTPVRRGKWLVCPAGGPVLVLHFGMTGSLTWSQSDRAPQIRARFDVRDGELQYRSQRKLGGLWLARDDGALEQLLEDIGPDALRVSERAFLRMLEQRSGAIKSALMDQAMIAGLGNLTVDEIVWRARLHPRTPIDSIDDRQRRRLFRDMRAVLHAAIPEGRVPPRRSWLTGRRDDEAARCPRCGTGLRRATVAGRTSVFCPACQP